MNSLATYIVKINATRCKIKRNLLIGNLRRRRRGGCEINVNWCQLKRLNTV